MVIISARTGGTVFHLLALHVKTSFIVVRHYDEERKKLCSDFCELAQVFKPNDSLRANNGATAENIFGSIMDSFRAYKNPQVLDLMAAML